MVLAVGSIGDGLALAVLLVACSADTAAGLTAGLAFAAMVVRFGSSSLSALAGAQAVLGPAGRVGPWWAAASAWAGASGLIVAAPAGWAAIAFGVVAAQMVAGPSPRTVGDVAVRAGATVGGAGLAWIVARWRPPRLRWGGVVVGVAAVALVTSPSLTAGLDVPSTARLTVALVGALGASALGLGAARGWPVAGSGALGALAVAVAAAGVTPAAWLLAAAAVVALPLEWLFAPGAGLVLGVPGAVAGVAALVRSGETSGAAVAAVAGLGLVGALSIVAVKRAAAFDPPTSMTRRVALALAIMAGGWLLLAPGTWAWVGMLELGPYDRAAAVFVAVAVVVTVMQALPPAFAARRRPGAAEADG